MSTENEGVQIYGKMLCPVSHWGTANQSTVRDFLILVRMAACNRDMLKIKDMENRVSF